MANNTPINVTVGQQIIDRSRIPFMRGRSLEMVAYDLKPYAAANVFMDSTNITSFVQPASQIATNVGTYSNSFTQGEGLYSNTTHAYASVIHTSDANNIYINENYVSMNLVPYGPTGSNTFSSSTFKVGDIVYQANNIGDYYSNTFVGVVEFWNYSDGALAVKPEYGTISNNASNIVLFKAGSTQLANVANVVYGNTFPVNAVVYSTITPGKFFLTNAYLHNHGVLAVSNGSTTQLTLSGFVTSNLVNKTIYFVGGTGVGQSSQITSVNTVTNSVTLSTPLTNKYDGTTRYAFGDTNITFGPSHYVNGIGQYAGIFHIPEYTNMAFSTGDKIITLNDSQTSNSPNATMTAHAVYSATGTPTSVLPKTVSTVSQTAPANPTSKGSSTTATSPTINMPSASISPLCQTFYTPSPNTAKQNYGIYASSVNLFFSAKPSGSSTQFPVTVRLVETNNGFPTSNVIASSIVQWADINTTNGSNTSPSSSNSATYTNFKFEDPVYLTPGTEYGIVVYSESPDYEVWISELGQPIINSTRLVSQSPSVGALFISQNASAYTPIQNQQLMFVLNKAQFTTTPATLTFYSSQVARNKYMDMSILHSSDVTYPVANITYALKTTIANTGAQDVTFFVLNTNDLFTFNGRRIIPAGNNQSTQVQVTLQTTDPDITPIFNSERLSVVGISNIINSGGIDASDVTITSPGVHSNAANITVSISAPTGDNGRQALANVYALVGTSVTAINIIDPGAGYVTAPTITISEPSATSNATAVVNGEDSMSGGNGSTRYITAPITLAEGFDAGDLVVYLNCVRPQGTDISVYYKVISAQDYGTLTNKPWQLMQKSSDIYSKDQSSQIQLKYITGTTGQLQYTYNGIQYPIGGTFKTFAIKIVCTTNDPTVPPIVNSMQGIAVPAG